MAPLRQLGREQPNAFLIKQKILWQRTPRHFSVRPWVIAMFISGGLRGTVRQIEIIDLRGGPIWRATQGYTKRENKEPPFFYPAHRGPLMQFTGPWEAINFTACKDFRQVWNLT